MQGKSLDRICLLTLRRRTRIEQIGLEQWASSSETDVAAAEIHLQGVSKSQRNLHRSSTTECKACPAMTALFCRMAMQRGASPDLAS